MRGLDAQFDNTDAIGREAIEAVLEKRSGKDRWIGGLALGLALLFGGGWAVAQSLAVRARFPDYETATGEQRTVTLADGSNLVIDTDAALDFSRDSTRRIITLFRGQVLARVAKDAARPFVVETRDGAATARGTAFIVRRDADATTIAVIESGVRACPWRAEPEACADLAPGDQARMTQGKLARLRRIDPETVAIWSEGWLAADDQPVARVLHELNRYRTQRLRFDDGELAGIRVSGSFPLADTDRALQGILQSTGLRLSRGGDGELWVRAE